MNLQAPQIIYLAIVLLSLGIDMANDGQIKQKKTSFWTSLIATAISMGLLYWGGFFS